METGPPTFEPPKRRRFQFRLRTLMIAVTALAIPLAWLAHHATIVRERKELLSLLVNRGGGYIYVDPSILGDEFDLSVGAFPVDLEERIKRPSKTLKVVSVPLNASCRPW
jgi:hypothetical protein